MTMIEPEVLVKLAPGAKAPEYKSALAAGMDLHCLELTRLYRGHWTKVRTGVSMKIPAGFEGAMRGRSGLAADSFEVFVGTIDSDYIGEISVLMKYTGDRACVDLMAGLRIAQILISPVARAQLRVVDELEPTERGVGGFGSTGLE